MPALIKTILTFIAGAIALGALLVGGDTLLFKNADVTQQALAAARANVQVQEELGTPIDIGWIVTGSISTQGISGDADLIIPVQGPKKGGTLYASARKSNGIWRYYTLAVGIDGKLITLQPQ